jgi:hypothetical protein
LNIQREEKSIHEDVLATITLIAENPNEDEEALIERLIAQGYEALQAELLIAFALLGLGRPVIARMEMQVKV